MIKKIKVEKYRKLKQIEFDFEKGINVLSGTNGTCKTSILHIISNSFQAVSKNNTWINEQNCIDIIKSINGITNPKIEALTKGDKKYNDPAPEYKGTLFSCNYIDGLTLDFRRHNSKTFFGKNRYSVKPLYKRGSKDSLPQVPIIYLGLSRLFSYGEYQNEENIKSINKKLPQKYLEEICLMYESFTGIKISYSGQQKMGEIKTRAEFSSDFDGIDSNTISAGEDNLFIIITSLVSLHYYFDSINSTREIESILLIDEIDATLHPAFQIKLLKILNEYQNKYKIQYIFTTHSLTLIENALENKYNVIYLMDNITSVHKMPDVDIYKIKMNLKSALKKDIYLNSSIPIFTEDAEARLFLNCMFDYYEREYKDKFRSVRGLFHFVDANISSDNLYNIFDDSKLLRSTMRSICILDGDQHEKHNLTNHVIVLPGKVAPETLIFNYVKELYDNDDPFWLDSTIQELGYTKTYYRDNIKSNIENIEKKIQEKKDKGETTKGIRREENKKLFNDYKRFFELVIKNWIESALNRNELTKFYNDLKILFRKVSEFHDISSKEWKD